MSQHVIRLLSSEEALAQRDALVDLLVDAVEAGAAVNFIWPMTRAKAEKWWDRAFTSLSGRLIFVAELDGRIDGTVQLVMAPQENQPHRADLAKMLNSAAGTMAGMGREARDAARERFKETLGGMLLTLDTESNGDGERLYARRGWIKFGEVPGYAFSNDMKTPEAASFFYKVL